MYYVYAISSTERNYIYVGMSNSYLRRLEEHNSGKEKTTKPYGPFQLLYFEIHSTRRVARIREKYWKSGIGKEQLRKLRLDRK